MKKILLLLVVFLSFFGAKSQCTIEVTMSSSGWGDNTNWQLLDASGTPVIDVVNGTYGNGYNDVQSVTSTNPPYTLVVTVNTNSFCDNFPDYSVTVGGVQDVAGQMTTGTGCGGSESYVINTPCPSCSPPTNAPVSGLSNSAATLNWTSTETFFDVEWGLSGFAPTGTPSVGYDDVASGVGLTGLTSATTYDYYLRTDCAAGGGSSQSPWVGPFSFTTLPACGDNLSGLCYSLTSTQEVLVSFEVATSGDWATLTFNAGGVETCCDEVVIYDGLNGTGNIIYGALTGGGLADYSGEGTITSTTGQLSLVVNSDVSATCNTNGFTPFDVTLNCVPPPACLAPTALTAGASSSDATLSWTSTETVFDVEWGLAGFVPTGTPSAGFDDVANNVLLPGLTSSTTYEYYVRADCAAGGGVGQSTWSGPFSFTTPCAPDIAPYTESFDGPSIDVCASISAVSGGPWRLGVNYTWNSCAAPTDHTGNGGSFISNDMSTPDAGVVYQLNDVDVSALTTPYLDMYHYMCGTYNNEVFIEAWDGAAWVQVGLINTSSPNWENYGYDLTGFTFAANLVRIRFRLEEGSTGTGFQFNSDVALDDISIIEAPSCFTPTALAAGLVSTSEAVLSWTSTETVFDLAIGVAPLAAPVAGDSVGVGNNLTVTGLTPNTTYEYYVRADCGAGGGTGQSTWAGPFSFFTGYCLPSSGSSATYVDNFTTTGGVTNINSVGTGFTAGGYFDGTASVVESFENGTFDFSAEIVGGTVGFSLWIDWNNDLIFDASEKEFNTTGYSNGPFIGTITVPAGTALGNYRMRITADWNSSNPNNPCANASRAEFEDYTLSVVAQPTCLPPTALTAAASSSDATLSWTSTETVFDVAVGVAPLAFPVAGDSVGVGNNLTVTGLTSNTTYEYYVRAACSSPSSLMISGVYDGPLPGGTPKGVELFVVNDIADLSIYGLSSANNGGGATGAPEFTFPVASATAGTFIYVASDSAEFTNFFGFAPDYTDGSMSINGDDAVELFESGSVIDVFGDVNTDGTGQAWDYLDGWAYRSDNESNNSGTFDETKWTYSGTNQLEGGVTNDSTTVPFPIASFSGPTADVSAWAGPFSFTTLPACGDNLTGLCYSLTNTQEVLVSFEVATPGDWATLTFNAGQVEACCDEVVIYDGLNGTGNIIYGALTGGGLSDYSGEGTITSTTGQLSLVVNSDVSVTCNSNGTYTSFDVTVNCFTPPCFEDTIPVIACDSIMLAGAMQTISGFYADSLTSVTGCDSIVTFDLTINSSDQTFASATSCNPADTGVVVSSFTNALGCDSIHTVTTTLLPTSFETVDVSDCDSVDVLGTWYFASTTFNDTIVGGAANGCDSITTFNVTVNLSDVTFENLTSCNPADTGVVVSSFTNALGCDSVHTVTTTLLPASFETVDVTDCDSTEVLGTWYFASTSFNDTIVGGAANGCDSITTFNLTLNSSSVGSVDTTICDDESLTLPDGAVVTAAGTYTSVVVGANGCDSVVTTELSVIMCTTGVEGIEGIETLSIYPNPYISTINLLFDDAAAGELNITLFDVTGRVLKAESVMTAIGANTISINVSPEVAAGVHILQIERDGAVYSTSIIKK